MRRTFFTLLMIVFMLVPSTAKAQGDEVTFNNLRVSLWPEYDAPSMLIIYRFNLSSDTSLPANLTMRIPASSGKPHAVAVGSKADMVEDVPYSSIENGEWIEISFIATMPYVQFEYYDPGLQFDGSERHFDYRWHGDYAVTSMTIEVQEPYGASQMRLSPNLGEAAQQPDGLVYHIFQVGSLSKGQSFNLALDYEKTSSQLTAEMLSIQSGQPLGAETEGRFSITNTLANATSSPGLVLAAGVLGLVLVLGGMFWYWRSDASFPRKTSRKAGRSRAARTQRLAAGPSISGAEGNVYCHHCGKRAADGDRFCRSCGTKLRME